MRGFVDNSGTVWPPGSGRARARTRGGQGRKKEAGYASYKEALKPYIGQDHDRDDRLVTGLLQLAETVNIQARPLSLGCTLRNL